MAYVDRAALQAGLDHVGSSPPDAGVIELLVRRPAIEKRELVVTGTLDRDLGVVGDNWARKPTSGTADGGPDPDAQVTVMNARAAALFADSEDGADWAPAGDQIYVDLDLSQVNLPPGTRLGIGAAVIEVSATPHLGCGKFSRRFGVDAMKVVNSERGRAMRLRGLNARVVEPGSVAVGDAVRKLT